MKNKVLTLLALLVTISLLAACAAPAPPATQPPAAEQPAAEQPAGECKDEDRVPITWSTIAGFYTDAMASLVADFEAQNCVKVTIVGIDNAQLYDKQIIEAHPSSSTYDPEISRIRGLIRTRSFEGSSPTVRSTTAIRFPTPT